MRVALSYLTMIKQASSSNFINFERTRDMLVTVRRWMTGRRGQPRGSRTLETIFHQERHSGRMVLLKSASWRCRKRRKKKKKKRTLDLCPRKSGKFAIHGWREFSAFFSPPLAISSATETAFIFTPLQVFATFQRDFSTSRVQCLMRRRR